ncbi:hypothetical protein [Falsiroseomonas oryziterrae]|uniref:hypothetical protein n=1 Tax=Falsiroseomonas oryziterrae TaxID=2911368 RepID=UPI001F38BDFF|nr:hypothetical protein [Roseomonas sp. NPKOSM-4]
MLRLAPLAFVLLATQVAMPVAMPAANETPVRVTTDSGAYCQELVVRIAAQPNPGSDIRLLAEEGKRLCETGHVRTGIAKLRRALRATQQGS